MSRVAEPTDVACGLEREMEDDVDCHAVARLSAMPAHAGQAWHAGQAGKDVSHRHREEWSHGGTTWRSTTVYDMDRFTAVREDKRVLFSILLFFMSPCNYSTIQPPSIQFYLPTAT